MVTAAERTTTLMTNEEFAVLSRDRVRRELWKGVVVEMSPVNHLHSRVAFRLSMSLGNVVVEHGLGEIWGADTGYTIELGPDTVVAPDLAFAPREYAETVTDASRGFPFFVPPLVVEVKSPDDREKEIAAKLAMYLGAGVGEVWWVRPKERTLTRHWPDRTPVVLGSGETVDDVEVLPGFSMQIDDMFPPDDPSQAPEGGTR